jgi:hypothetical protein
VIRRFLKIYKVGNVEENMKLLYYFVPHPKLENKVPLNKLQKEARQSYLFQFRFKLIGVSLFILFGIYWAIFNSLIMGLSALLICGLAIWFILNIHNKKNWRGIYYNA